MSAHQSKILIVEDEIELSEIFRDYLIAEGYEVELMHTGHGVVDYVRNADLDLILLDLMLPVVDGLSICREVRQFSDIPIIMVTAKIDELDRLLGLDIGADDYICKPAKPREVVARVKAVLRRTNSNINTATLSKLKLDHTHYYVWWDDEEFEVTRVEFRLLSLLARNLGQVCSRSQIMEAIYDDGRYVSDRSIDSHVTNLRRKLAAASEIQNPIRSIYGRGYALDIDSEENDSK
jgi:two-component system, OmpR family, response regulator BaeR